MKNKRIQKIYLAGKVEKNGWREQIINIRDILSTASDLPLTFNIGLNEYLYTGPCIIGCDHGCFHSSTSHGSLGGCSTGSLKGDKFNHKKRVKLHELCLKQISESDIVFAYIDCNTCFGTIAEIGYARALSKKIVINTPSINNDLWFVYNMADEIDVSNDILNSFINHCNLRDLRIETILK